MPVVRMLISLAASNFSYAPGDLVMVRDDVAEEWIRIGHAEAHDEATTIKLAELEKDSALQSDKPKVSVAVPPDPEAFAAKNAGEQKELLNIYGVEGDDSNEEKRLALYEAYLQKVGESNGAETDSGTGGGTADAGGGEATPAG